MSTLYGLKESISNLYKSSYAKQNSCTEQFSNLIDCSSGANPFGFSSQVETALKSMPLTAISLYPESNKNLQETIISYWQEVADLKDSNILFGSGTIDIIYKINKLFLDNQSKVLGYSPQFSDYVDDIKSYGGVYDYHLLTAENNFKFDYKLFLEKIEDCHKLVYIDNPNNPTGQIIPLAVIETIVQKAESLQVCVIIDEAYGDFMDKTNSAIGLLNKYNNVFVLRSFSKGLGLAGIRGGYMVTSENFSNHYRKISNPYVINGIANYLTIPALKDTQFIDDCIKKVKTKKVQLINSFKKLKVLETSLQVPIMTIKHPDSHVNLVELLERHNILSVSGESFIGLDKSFARIRVPSETDSLIQAFKVIEDEI